MYNHEEDAEEANDDDTRCFNVQLSITNAYKQVDNKTWSLQLSDKKAFNLAEYQINCVTS